MEVFGKNSGNEKQLCKLCNRNSSLYTCPKCEIPYCSLDCYKSEIHLDCSENFYKECVEGELKTRENSDSRAKMLDILQRMKEEMSNDVVGGILEENSDEDEMLDSDDEEPDDLEDRLKNINLDDPNEIWSALTDTERQEFEASVKSGQIETVIPQWTPWWTFIEEKKFVQEIDENESNKKDYVEKCPAILDVPKFNELLKAAPCVRFNLENTLYSYVYMALFFNGEYLNSASDAALIFLDLCDNMRENVVFHDSESASNAVMERLKSGETLPVDEDACEMLKKAVDSIIKGPEKDNRTFFIKSLLSDLHAVLNKAKSEKFSKKSAPEQEFPKKFAESSFLSKRTEITKKQLQMCLKKIEYYLSWMDFYGEKFIFDKNKLK